MHWHAFTYDGRFPADSEAKNPQAAVRPLALADWYRKPASMRRGTHEDAASAYAWLEAELREVFPDPARLDSTLAHHLEHLELGQDAYASAYSTGGSSIWVRALLTCPRVGADPRPVRCPEPPLVRA